MAIRKIFIQGKYPNSVTEMRKLISVDDSLCWINVSSMDSADLILFFDVLPNSHEKTYKVMKVLVRLEPEIILPENYKSKNLREFDKIISVGRSKYSENGVNWPQLFKKPKVENLSRKNSKIVMVNSDLINFHKNELYSLRRKVLFNSNEIDLYGNGWNSSCTKKFRLILSELKKLAWCPFQFRPMRIQYFLRNTPAYHGTIVNKLDVMATYQIALIIENSEFYLSEKLFDAFLAGCIPIYVGPGLQEYDIPEDLVVKSESDLNSIIEAIKIAKSIDYISWATRVNNWINKPSTVSDWSQETFMKRLKIVIDA